MSALDMSDTIASQAAIPILVVSVGSVSKDKYKKYFDVIQDFKQARLSELNSMSSTNYRTNDGLVTFKYLESVPSKESWQLDDMIYNQRILGVVGLIDCRTTPDLTAAAAEFDAIAKKIPTSLGSRCFAFEPSEAQEDNAQGVIMIPDQSIGQVKFYISTQLTDFGSSLLDVLNSLLKKKIQERHMANPRILRAPFERTITADETKQLRKRAPARNEKQIGDIYLMTSLTKEAQLHYYECIEQSKSTADWAWHGAALEAYAASVILKSRSIGSTESSRDVVDRMQDAITSFSKVKGAQNLYIGASFRLVLYLAGIKDKATAAEVLTNVVTYDTIPSEDAKAKLYRGLAHLYGELGFNRKSAFYTRQLTILVSRGAQKSHWQVAHALLLKCMEPYKITSLKRFMASTRVADAHQTAISRVVPRHDGGWASLQAKILKDLVLTSKCLGNRKLTVDYISYILQTMHHSLPANEQEDMSILLDTLDTKITSDCTRYNWTSMPCVLNVTPALGPVAGKPVRRTAADSTAKSPFLYSAFGVKKQIKQLSQWVAEEVAEVSLTLTNLFEFPLVCKDISIEVSGVAFENYPMTVILPPKAENVQITLLGKPMEPGKLTIEGIRVHCFGVRCIHALPASVEVIEVLPRYPQLVAKHGILDKIRVPMDLLEGELLKAELRLENVGKDLIDWVMVTTVPIRSAPDAKSIVQVTTTVDPIMADTQGDLESWDANAPRRQKNEEKEKQFQLQREKERLEDSQFEVPEQQFLDDRLPLRTNDVMCVPILVHGHVGCRGCIIKISYGNSKLFPESMREYELRFEVNVSRALMFSRFDVLRLDQADTETLKALHILPATPETKINVNNLCLLSFDIINNSRHSFGLVFKAGRERDSTHKEKAILYSPIKRDWEFTPMHTMLEGYCVRRVMLPIVRQLNGYTTPPLAKDILPILCGDLLTQWNLGTRQSEGRIWFKEPSVSPLSLTRIFRHGLEVELEFRANTSGLHAVASKNNVPPTVRVEKSELFDITIRVTNITEDDLSNVRVRFVPYQDAMNGLKLYDVDPQMARLGLWDVFLGPMRSGQTKEHKLAAMFLSSGMYKLAYELTPVTDDEAGTATQSWGAITAATDVDRSAWSADAVNIHVHRVA